LRSSNDTITAFDPFPDENRTLPFGSGAGVFYNYIDLRFSNPTEQTFQFRVWLTEDHLKGAVYTDPEPEHSYHVFERNHRFTTVAEPTIARMKFGVRWSIGGPETSFEKNCS
jgi:vancomycin resistance protein YoaR